MMVDVFMADGRTCFRLRRRADLVRLVRRDVKGIDTEGPVRAWVKWHCANEGDAWERTKLMSLRAHLIGFVVTVPREDADVFERLLPLQEEENPPVASTSAPRIAESVSFAPGGIPAS